MRANQYKGLLVNGVKFLGSVTSNLAQWARANYDGLFDEVRQVKVSGLKQHWGGIVNRLTGGERHRQTITPDQAYFGRQDRFLLRECSVGVGGHFIIQTGVDEFWEPNRSGNPETLASIIRRFPALSLRADACQFDVASDPLDE